MRSMMKMLAVLLALVAGREAAAVNRPLDPMNRFHAGLSIADHGSMGLQTGLDSRLTRIVQVDVGAWLSPLVHPEVTVDLDNGEPSDWITLRHGIYVAPGVRIPHRYGRGINWDWNFRAGFGAVWLTDAAADYIMQYNAGLMPSTDLLLRRNSWGLRVGIRGVYFRPYVVEVREELFLLRAQTAVEAVYQF